MTRRGEARRDERDSSESSTRRANASCSYVERLEFDAVQPPRQQGIIQCLSSSGAGSAATRAIARRAREVHDEVIDGRLVRCTVEMLGGMGREGAGQAKQAKARRWAAVCLSVCLSPGTLGLRHLADSVADQLPGCCP
jgi:hypothetical protein